jgi:hypothetical protein
VLAWGQRRLARTSQGQAPVYLCSQPREAVQLGVVPDGVLRDGLRHVVHVAELGLLLDPEVRSHGPDSDVLDRLCAPHQRPITRHTPPGQ